MSIVKEIRPPIDNLVYANENIRLKIGEKLLESGILYLTHDALLWRPQSRYEGISIPWNKIGVHGISSNPSKYIYVMLDHKLYWEGVYDPGSLNLNGGGVNNQLHQQNGDGDGPGPGVRHHQQQHQQQNNAADDDEDEGNESDCGEEDFTELWLVPTTSNSNCVDDIFQAIKDIQTLHPESGDSISDESDFMDAQDIGIEDDDDQDDIGEGEMENLNINDEKFADAEDQ